MAVRCIAVDGWFYLTVNRVNLPFFTPKTWHLDNKKTFPGEDTDTPTISIKHVLHTGLKQTKSEHVICSYKNKRAGIGFVDTWIN